MSPSNQLSSDQWLNHVTEWRASGLTRHTYCSQHGIKLNSLIYWIKRSKRLESTALPPLTFVPTQVISLTPDSAVNGLTTIQGEAAPSFILECRSGCNLILPASISAAWLGALLSALV